MRRSARSPESLLPLKELELQILLALEEEALHGYALLKRLSERTGGLGGRGPASLYRALARLTDEGLLEDGEAAVRTASTDPRRRYFRPSAFGRSVLRAELRRLDGVLARARAAGIGFEGGAR